MKYFKVISDGLNLREGPGLEFLITEVLPKGRVIQSPDFAGWIPVMVIDEDGEKGAYWVKAEFLVETQEPVVTQPIKPVSGEPPWITWARSKVGIHESPGAADNPEILSWFKWTTLDKEYWHDATAWCAVFVNAALFNNGKEGDRSARAVDFLNWGTNVDDDPQIGDVAVFEWDNGSHHVALVLSVKDGTVNVVGGNQSDAVTKTSYDQSFVIGFRRPA